MSKADWGNVLGTVVMAACLVLSIWLGVRKNRPVLGAVLGFFLTFIGVVIMLIVPRRTRPTSRRVRRPVTMIRRRTSGTAATSATTRSRGAMIRKISPAQRGLDHP